jgi:putative ABC transport system permease protein
MPFLDAIRLALSTIRAQKLKSFFTLLGVTIGVMFLIAVVSIVEGMSKYMENDLVGKLMAVNSFELRRRPNINIGDVDESVWMAYRKRRYLLEEDLQPVVAALPEGTRWAMGSEDNITVESHYSRPRKAQVRAVDGDWFAIKKLGVERGRLFTEQELARGDNVIIIGVELEKRLFPGVDPIGRELKMGGLPYTIVGVGDKQGSAFGLSFDNYAIAPFRAPVHRLLNRRPRVIDAVIVQATDAKTLPEAMERVRQVMRARHKLHPAQNDDFSLETPESALEFFNKIKQYMVLAGVALPALGLVVGAIVIMNIMLVAVAERTREIGVRKALGARSRDILTQFLIESATLSTVGAIVGIGLGFVLAWIITEVTPMPASVAPWSIIVGVLVGAGTGIVSGVYPASRAARLDPITALRQE